MLGVPQKGLDRHLGQALFLVFGEVNLGLLFKHSVLRESFRLFILWCIGEGQKTILDIMYEGLSCEHISYRNSTAILPGKQSKTQGLLQKK